MDGLAVTSPHPPHKIHIVLLISNGSGQVDFADPAVIVQPALVSGQLWVLGGGGMCWELLYPRSFGDLIKNMIYIPSYRIHRVLESISMI